MFSESLQKLILAQAQRDLENLNRAKQNREEQILKENSELVNMLSSMRTSDRKPRFNKDEIKYIILKCAKSRNPRNYDFILTAKNKDGTYRFKANEIESLIDSFNELPPTFYILKNMENPDGNYRFNGSDLIALVKSFKAHHDASEALVDMKNPDGTYALNCNDIERLAPLYDRHKDEITDLINIKNNKGKCRFQGYQIAMLLPIAKECKEEIEELAQMKNKKGENLFEASAIEAIAPCLKKYPFQVRTLFYAKDKKFQPLFSASDIKYLAPIAGENLNEIFKLINMKDESGEKRFNAYQIQAIAPFAKDNYDKIEFLDNIRTYEKSIFGGQLIETPIFNYVNIATILPTFEERKKDIEKFLKEIDPNFDVNHKGVQILNNKYQIEAKKLQNNAGYVLKATKSSKTTPPVIKEIVLDENGNLLKSTTCEYEGKSYLNKEFETWYYQGNSTILINYNDPHNKNDINFQIEIINDENNSPSEIIYTKKSDKLTGAFETTRYILSDYPEDFDILYAIKTGVADEIIEQRGYPKGEKLSKVETFGAFSAYSERYQKDGITTKRSYSFKVDDFNQPIYKKYSYKIKDENNNTLTSIKRTWQKNSPNSTTTVVNGKKYQANFDDENMAIEIIDDLGNITKFSIEDKTVDIETYFSRLGFLGADEYNYIKHKFGNKFNMQKAFYEFCKTLGADTLLVFAKNVKGYYVVGTGSGVTRSKILSIELDEGTMAHELAHTLDFNTDDKKVRSGVISSNKELIEIYNKEMGEFKKNYPHLAQEFVDYFSQEGGGSFGTGLSEFVAEVNMLSTTYNLNAPTLNTRSQYLVRNFPLTIAKIISLLKENQP